MKVDVAPHVLESRAWSQTSRGGMKEDRTLREITVRMPPSIATTEPGIPSELGAGMHAALRTMARLDEIHGEHL